MQLAGLGGSTRRGRRRSGRWHSRVRRCPRQRRQHLSHVRSDLPRSLPSRAAMSWAATSSRPWWRRGSADCSPDPDAVRPPGPAPRRDRRHGAVLGRRRAGCRRRRLPPAGCAVVAVRAGEPAGAARDIRQAAITRQAGPGRRHRDPCMLRSDGGFDGFERFEARFPPGSHDFVLFDRVLCALEQAGDAWASPASAWAAVETVVRGLRDSRGDGHLREPGVARRPGKRLVRHAPA